jgi:hypothetical protein
MISGLSGSPAPMTSRSFTGNAPRSSWMNSRQTVGGAHSVVTPQPATVLSTALALNRA